MIKNENKIVNITCVLFGFDPRLLDGAGNGLLDVHSLLVGDLIFKHFYILWSFMKKDLDLGTWWAPVCKIYVTKLSISTYFLSLFSLLPSSYPLRNSLFLPQPGQLLSFSP